MYPFKIYPYFFYLPLNNHGQTHKMSGQNPVSQVGGMSTTQGHSHQEDIESTLHLMYFRASETHKSWENCGLTETKWAPRQ